MCKKLKCDLHVHTLLSPCAEMEMMPGAIVKWAAKAKLDVIAITDHNTTSNVKSVVAAGEKYGLKVVPGIEIQTREEVHILGLFESIESAEEIGRRVREFLPDIPNDEDHFGVQVLMDSNDKILGQEELMLLNSTGLSLEEVVELILQHNGLPVCSHVDRLSYGIIGQLGFIPSDLPVKVVEISGNMQRDEIIKKYPYLDNYKIIKSSDAHRLDDIGKCFTKFNSKLHDWKVSDMILKG